MKIATVLHYCSNDWRFLPKMVEEISHFSDQIVIPVSSHFFNGQEENRPLLEQNYRDFPLLDWVEFLFLKERLYSPFSLFRPEDEGWIRLWHGTARYIGLLHVREEIDWVLFLDADEIPEGKRVSSFLRQEDLSSIDALRFSAYYYVLRATLRCHSFQNLVLLAKKQALLPHFFLQTDERHGLYQRIEGNKRKEVLFEQKPLFHHYSWVRSKEESLQKASSWGHCFERNWKKEIEEAFANNKGTLGRDDLSFFEIETPYFNPLNTPFPQIQKGPPPRIRKVGPREVLAMELRTIVK